MTGAVPGGIGLVLVGIVATLQVDSLPAPFPREGVTKVAESAHMVVWQGFAGIKGRPTAMHRHDLAMVGVFLDDGGRTRVTRPDGTSSVSSEPTSVGGVVFQPRGVVHSEEALVDGIRAVAIELKEASDKTMNATPHTLPIPAGARLLLENERVVIWEHQWRATPAVISSTADALVVMLESGNLRDTGRGAEEQRTFGQVVLTSLDTIGREVVSRGAPRAVVVVVR